MFKVYLPNTVISNFQLDEMAARQWLCVNRQAGRDLWREKGHKR
jgi:hypothetical protein